jgi:COMM domain containing 10
MSEFKFAKNFEQVAKVCNRIAVEKFPLLLSKLIKKLHVKGLRLFNDEERQQLQSIFDLNAKDLDLVLGGCCFIFEQAAFTSTGPEPLYTVLLNAGFDQAHGKVIGKVWAEEAPSFVDKLKNRNLGSPSLVDTDYHLNLTLGVNDLSRLQEPTAIFEFSVSDPSKEISTTSAHRDVEGGVGKVSVEFGHNELYDFFEKLESVQRQLDRLS